MSDARQNHSDNSQLLKWVYTRIWNAREEGMTMTTIDIIREMSGYFRLNLSTYQLDGLKKRIDRVRNTVNKGFLRHERMRQKLAYDWRTDIRLIRRWERAGILNLSDHRGIERMTALLNERDYVALINPEEIPVDPTVLIWDRH